jgi:PAS domain S-box-containing protein
MEFMEKIQSTSKRQLSLIWSGFLFGLLYWILESVRDVLVFEKGTLIERIFTPDYTSFWYRLLVVCILVLYSIYVASVRKSMDGGGNGFAKFLEKMGIVGASMAFGGFYWILESVQDYLLLNEGDIFDYILTPDPMRFWMKMLAVSFICLFSLYARNLINERRKAEETLKKTRVKLEKLIEERTSELTESNSRLQQEVRDRKKAEKALALSKKSFHNIVERGVDAIVVKDEEGNVCFVNSAVESLFGRQADTFIGRKFEFPMTVGETSELEIEHKDGKKLVSEMRVVATEWEGRPACMASLRDITERKRIEEQLKQANQKLRKLDEMKSDFISTVSHELRTPVAIMRQGISVCLDGVAGDITDKQNELLSNIMENIDRLDRLVTDLLDISKIESGKVKLRLSAIDIEKVLEKIKTNFYSKAKKKGIQFRIEQSEKHITLFGDEDKIIQIFNNLVSNAIRFTFSGGSITIRVEEKIDMIGCCVEDTGIGISRKDMPKLFSKFEQFGRVIDSEYMGTGLGLAIAKGLVEKHGGKIWVESEQGKGTTFYFTLKKTAAPKILICDDEPEVVDVIKRFLKEDNYELIEAKNGKQAVEMAQSQKPSLVVLDLMIPGLNGYQVIERLKQNKCTKDIPVLLLSGYAVDEERLDQIDSRTNYLFIEKPIQSDALRYNVREMLNN